MIEDTVMLNRRTLLKSFCAGSALALAEAKAEGFRGNSELGGDLRIWDQHSHLGSVPRDTPEERMAFLVKCMDRMGVERLILSQGYSADQHPNPPERFRLENDRVMRAVKAFPDRAYGSVNDREILWQEKDVSMVACVDCHKLRKAPVNCDLCHNIGH